MGADHGVQRPLGCEFVGGGHKRKACQVGDLGGDGLEMRLARARADHVEIRERRNAAQIERDDVLGFFLGGVERALLGYLFGGNGGVSFGAMGLDGR